MAGSTPSRPWHLTFGVVSLRVFRWSMRMSSCRSDMCSHLFCQEMVNGGHAGELGILPHNQDDIRIARLHLRRRGGVLIPGKVLRVDDGHDGVELEIVVRLAFKLPNLEC